jgi:hypothetical protein
MTATEHVVRWSTAAVVVGVAAVAAVASYQHAYALVGAHGEAGWTRRLVSLTADGLILTSSMVMLDSARQKTAVPALERWLLDLGIGATLAANVAHGLGHGAVAAWPAVALVDSYELLMMVIRGAQAAPDGASGSAGVPESFQEEAAEVSADQLAADRISSIRAIRARLHVGQPRAQRLRDYLAARATEAPLTAWAVGMWNSHGANSNPEQRTLEALPSLGKLNFKAYSR